MSVDRNKQLYYSRDNIEQSIILYNIKDQNNLQNSESNSHLISPVNNQKLFSKKNNYTPTRISVNSSETNLSNNKNLQKNPLTISSNSVDNITSNIFNSKVILENISSINECIYLLENYLTENNITTKYQTSNEGHKIIFSFSEEKIAFNFTKIIYNEKNTNPLYRDVKVFFALNPNQDFMKKKIIIKKRGISPEIIEKLFRGEYRKQIKPVKQNLGNYDLGISSPFYSADKKYKLNKNKSGDFFLNANGRKINKRKILSNEDLSREKQQPLKDYNKFKISVLDTHYHPISNFLFREEDKNKWVSPNNFQCY